MCFMDSSDISFLSMPTEFIPTTLAGSEATFTKAGTSIVIDEFIPAKQKSPNFIEALKDKLPKFGKVFTSLRKSDS